MSCGGSTFWHYETKQIATWGTTKSFARDTYKAIWPNITAKLGLYIATNIHGSESDQCMKNVLTEWMQIIFMQQLDQQRIACARQSLSAGPIRMLPAKIAHTVTTAIFLSIPSSGSH